MEIKRMGLPVLLVMMLMISANAQNYLSGVECVNFDEAHNRYLVSSMYNGRIVAIDMEGNQSIFKQGLSYPLGNCIHGNTIYVATGTTLKGYDLDSGTQVMSQYITGSMQLDGMTTDNNGYLYVTDLQPTGQDKIYKFNLETRVYWMYVRYEIFDGPQDIYFDEPNNRLITCSYLENSPIQAIDLADSSVTDLVLTPMGDFDGIARGNDGYYYLSIWADNSVIRYDADFTNPPETFATGFSSPSNLCINLRDDILAVPSFYGNCVDFIPLSTSVGGGEISTGVPSEMALLSNYPNPFNPATTLSISLMRDSEVRLAVYDIGGRQVKVLAEEYLTAGTYTYNFNAGGLSSGIYCARLSAGVNRESIKIMYIK